MSDTASGLLTIAVIVAALALCHRPLGDYMAHVFTDTSHWRVERVVYRVVGVNPDSEQRWRTYATSLIAFSVVSIVLLVALLLGQGLLPGPFGAVTVHGAINTAVSFTTNTNWQWYAGESTLNNLTQMLGLAVQNFASAAVGLAVAIALVRGFARQHSDRIGNFWVDLVRATLRILVPLSLVAAIVLVTQGVIQNFTDATTFSTLSGGTQTTLPGGPVASQEAIKELGTNGGGFFNANSGHPFENPNPFTNAFEIFLILLIPTAIPRTLGRMVGDRRQGYAVLAAMTVLFGLVLTLVTVSELAHNGTAPQAAGGAMEGKEQQFGIWGSALFATATTATSTGAVNASHDSLTAGGGGGTLVNMLLGELSPGGVGSGLYAILIAAILAVFIAGLMVGRTPEYLKKKISRVEITYVALYTLVMPALVLVGTGLTIGLASQRTALLNSGPHGLSELFYAFASAANNNGSAFAGITVSTPYYNLMLAAAMFLGRFVPIVLVLGLAGRLASQPSIPNTEGTLPTHKPLFVGLLVGVILLVAGLTFVPALALAPIAEALQ